jgi:hypothetical protein
MNLRLDGRHLFVPGDAVELRHDPNVTGKRQAIVIAVRVSGRSRVLYELALYDDRNVRVEFEVDEFEVQQVDAAVPAQ